MRVTRRGTLHTCVIILRTGCQRAPWDYWDGQDGSRNPVAILFLPHRLPQELKIKAEAAKSEAEGQRSQAEALRVEKDAVIQSKEAEIQVGTSGGYFWGVLLGGQVGLGESCWATQKVLLGHPT